MDNDHLVFRAISPDLKNSTITIFIVISDGIDETKYSVQVTIQSDLVEELDDTTIEIEFDKEPNTTDEAQTSQDEEK